jgi:hypothetical protein
MWILFFVCFVVGIIAGLILGNWLDQRDVLYSCPRCKVRGGQRAIRVESEPHDPVMQDVLSRVWETGHTVVATVDDDGKATITELTT